MFTPYILCILLYMKYSSIYGVIFLFLYANLIVSCHFVLTSIQIFIRVTPHINTLETELTNRFRKKWLSTVFSASYNRTDGHCDDMGFEQYGGYGKIGYDLTSNWNLSADINMTHFNASYLGPVSAPLSDGDQRITRGVTSLSLANQYEKTSGTVSFFCNWGNHWINDGYTPLAGEGPKDCRFQSRDNLMGISVYLFNGNRTNVRADWFKYGGRA